MLIMNVAQDLPSYTMSCFLIPKSLCQEIEQMFNNYWWRSGVANNPKGLNRLSWNKICVTKHKGGMSFRDLYGFNITLLGKYI